MRKCYIVLMAAASLAVGGAWADTEMVGGYTWTYRITGDTAEIYKNTTSAAISPKPKGLVMIPPMLGGKPVTRIGDRAFYSCVNLSVVMVPESVTAIGRSAFSGCTSLAMMTIPDGVTEIGERTFYNCKKLALVTIPDGVKEIGGYAFYGCRYLTMLTLPSSVTNIGNRAFYSCEALKSIAIPDSVTDIGTHAFYRCKALTNVTLGNGVANIGGRAFSSCKGLAEFAVAVDNPFYRSVSGLLLTKDGKTLVAGVNGDVIIPYGVTRIGDSAFYGCSKLTSVTIPESVTSIAEDAFVGCSGLERKYGGVVDDPLFAKAQTKKGALYDTIGGIVGMVELKFGRLNAQQGTVKISAAATILDGGKMKKVSAKGVDFRLDGGVLSDVLPFRAPIGDMAFAMLEDGSFTLKNDDYEMVGLVVIAGVGTRSTIHVGGVLAKEQIKFSVEMDSDPDFGKDGALLAAALPNEVIANVVGGKKLDFGKAASPKYKKNQETGVYELVGIDDPSRPNKSGLRLTYTPKTGMFKGSFKVYATNAATIPEGKAPRLKKYTANVTGVVIDGKGYGSAIIKKVAATASVIME